MAENHQVALIGADPEIRAQAPNARRLTRLRALAWPAALLLILIGAFWKLTLTRAEYSWLESPDLAEQVLPWLQYEAAELHRGNLPLWDPHEWAGQSLIGQAQPSLVSPLSWPLFAAPLNRGWLRRDVLTGWLVFIHFCGGLFCYLLCRDLGRSRMASLLGGAAFALAGWFGTTDWPQMLSGGVWAPLEFLFFFRALRLERPIRNAALSGAMLGVAFLSGHHQIPMFTGLALAGCWLYFVLLDSRSALRWACLPAFAGMAGLCGAIQILPASAYAKTAVRWVGSNHAVRWNEIVPYRVHESLGLPPASILGVLLHNLNRGADLMLGGTVLVLALSAIVICWNDRSVRVLAAVAAAGLLFSFGGWTVFHGIVYSLVPEMNKARNAAFGVFLFAFGMVPLAAFGLDSLHKIPARMRHLTIGGLSCVGALLVIVPWTLMQTNLPKTGDYNLTSWCGVLLFILAITLWMFWAGRIRNPGLALLAIALLEFSTSVGYGYRPATDTPLLRKLAAHGQIAEWLERRPGAVRVETDDQEIPYNFSDWYGIDQYASIIPTLTIHVDQMRGAYWGRMLMGVNYWIGRRPLRANQRLVFTDSNGVNVYYNDDAFPRAWSVHRAVGIPPQPLEPAFNAAGPALREQAFFVGAPAPRLESCSGDTIDVLKRNPDSIRIDAAMNCRGLVVMGENFDPGWRAFIDGQSTPVLEAYGVARGVVVPRGHHRIEMLFRPPSVLLGAILSGLGMTLMAVLLFL